MPRNPRPAWRGIGGRHAAESGAGIGRNTQIGQSAAMRSRRDSAGLGQKREASQM